MSPGIGTIFLPEEGTPKNVTRPKLLLFMITGNPGLVEYYRTYLTLCYDTLRDSLSIPRTAPEEKIDFHVASTSLVGFGHDASGQPLFPDEKQPYSLEQQISYIDSFVDAACVSIAKSQSSGQPIRVILAGHSVGSYILLEVLRRRQTRSSQEEQTTQQSQNVSKIIGGILLFPTVTNIAGSPSGKKISFLLTIPSFPYLVQLLANLLTVWMPFHTLQNIVAFVTGMPPDAAKTTVGFIANRVGVRQSLSLAKDEMASITTDKWDDELWGVARTNESEASDARVKLCFYFGDNDHWVANESRDRLIASRAKAVPGGDDDKPLMEIDQTGIPHSFCIKHNGPVSQKTADYVREIVRSNW